MGLWWIATRRRCGLAALVTALLTAVVLAMTAAGAAAAVTKDEAVKRVESQFGVKVLRVKAGEVDGRPVWFVTAMEQGGNSNSAFQVSTQAIDQETGELVPGYRAGMRGPDTPTAAGETPQVERQPDVLRSRTWR